MTIPGTVHLAQIRIRPEMHSAAIMVSPSSPYREERVIMRAIFIMQVVLLASAAIACNMAGNKAGGR